MCRYSKAFPLLVQLLLAYYGLGLCGVNSVGAVGNFHQLGDEFPRTTRLDYTQNPLIISKSGSGKSTLLRCINGLEEFQSGTLTVDGKPLLHHNAAAMRELR